MIADAYIPAGVYVFAGLAVLCAVAFVALLLWAARQARRPLTETDRYCSAVDAELDERERRERERRVRGGLEVAGAAADRVGWSWPGRPEYAPFGDPEFEPDRARRLA